MVGVLIFVVRELIDCLQTLLVFADGAPPVGFWRSLCPCCCPCKCSMVAAWICTTLSSADGWSMIMLVAVGGSSLGMGVALQVNWPGRSFLKGTLITIGLGAVWFALRWWQQWSRDHVQRNNDAIGWIRRASGGGQPPAVHAAAPAPNEPAPVMVCQVSTSCRKQALSGCFLLICNGICSTHILKLVSPYRHRVSKTIHDTSADSVRMFQHSHDSHTCAFILTSMLHPANP